MLSENVYVNKDGVDIKEVTKYRWMFNWRCPKCLSSYIITKDNIEDFLASDSHDPLQDYMVCPVCEKYYGLFNGVDGKSDGAHAKIWADGTYVYLNKLGRDIRIV